MVEEATPKTIRMRMKLRWSLFLLALIATFVVLANSPRSTHPPAAAQRTDSPPHPLQRTVSDAPDAPEQAEDTWRGETGRQLANLVAPPSAPHPDDNGSPPAVKYTVQRGDTMSSILNRHDVYRDMVRLMTSAKGSSRLFRLIPGDTIELVIDNGRLLSIRRRPDKTSYIEAALQGDHYTVREETIPTTIRQAFVTGTVSDSFYSSGLAAGMSDALIHNAADVLGWDIDFVLDVRKGDTFVVVYNEQWLDGEKIRDLEITSVEYFNRGKSYRATRYTTSAGKVGYYTPDGKSVKRPFIRTPLQFSRISSHFNPRRLHPILKVWRPHRGIDYAAPTGTPVYSTSDGKIIFRGRKRGYGNVVIVRHGRRYSTLYAHLSRFARGQRVGSRVRQKQVIGYVGATGYATGPHLHYEFRVNGTHKNPLSVKLPGAQSLPRTEIKRYMAASRSAWARLDTLGRHLLASE